MARGGVRPGSGRPKGGVNKLDQEARKAALASGISPLDFLLAAMRDESREFPTRLDAAKAAAPYVHARLSSVEQKNEHSGPDGTPIQHEHRATVWRVVDPKAAADAP